jgi:pimeloyl-ACP methyl ester carboxylesterase
MRHSARQRGRAMLGVIAMPVLLYAAALGALYFQQEALLFRPSPLPADHRFPMGVREVLVPVDGATLHAVHFSQPAARGLVFFLHGNGGNNAVWLTSTDFYERTGFDLFMIDYRGYGKSSGSIESEAQLHADVLASFRAVAPQYAGRKIVIYGRSLGTGLAARLATMVDADLLVLVSPYSSLRELADEHYPWVPAALLRYPMPTGQWLTQVREPTLIFHGERDTLIGIEHSHRLLQKLTGAELVRLPEAGHHDVHRFDAYLDTLAERLARL